MVLLDLYDKPKPLQEPNEELSCFNSILSIIFPPETVAPAACGHNGPIWRNGAHFPFWRKWVKHLWGQGTIRSHFFAEIKLLKTKHVRIFYIVINEQIRFNK